MEYVAQVDAVERELSGLVAAVGAGPLGAPVPTCPGFTVDDLAAHVGEFCGWWTHNLCEGTGRAKTPYSDDVGPEGRVEWLRAIGEHLVTELRAAASDTVVWTWNPSDQSAAFVARRTSNELAVHRVDMQLARGGADPVDAELAVDGIEEIVVIMTRGRPVDPALRPTQRQTLHLHGTDHEASEWFIVLDHDGVQVTHEHAKGDLALKGSVSDLEMVLYQRPTVGAVERFGDESVLETFYREFTF